jgi:hypothetical protein
MQSPKRQRKQAIFWAKRENSLCLATPNTMFFLRDRTRLGMAWLGHGFSDVF